MAHKHSEDCRHLLSSLSDYVDGTAGDAICDEIERHLADCENCRVVVDTLKKTVYLVQASTEEESLELPTDVRVRLFHALKLEDFLNKPQNQG
ncbi:MAG: anti-sigma factor family protein [Anaerolineales bacterium]|jgi:anti-sigma factor RsiW